MVIYSLVKKPKKPTFSCQKGSENRNKKILGVVFYTCLQLEAVGIDEYGLFFYEILASGVSLEVIQSIKMNSNSPNGRVVQEKTPKNSRQKGTKPTNQAPLLHGVWSPPLGSPHPWGQMGWGIGSMG